MFIIRWLWKPPKAANCSLQCCVLIGKVIKTCTCVAFLLKVFGWKANLLYSQMIYKPHWIKIDQFQISFQKLLLPNFWTTTKSNKMHIFIFILFINAIIANKNLIGHHQSGFTIRSPEDQKSISVGLFEHRISFLGHYHNTICNLHVNWSLVFLNAPLFYVRFLNARFLGNFIASRD